MPEFRVLTVRQPWAAAIIYLGKPVENRSRNVAGSWRGLVAIHAAGPKRADLAYINGALESPYFDTTVLREKYKAAVQDPWWGLVGGPGGLPVVSGSVLGVVDLVDVHSWHDCWATGPLDDDESRMCSPWAMPGHHHLVLRDPRPLRVPVRARGRLGLWRPDEDLTSAIWAQVGEAA